VVLGAEDVARAAPFFPVVGAGIGAVGGLVAAGLEGPLPPFVAAGVALAVVVALTGALHVDALGDTADAIGAGRARALEVMRDSRIGAFGAVAVALAVLVEAGAVGGLASGGDAVAAWTAAGALSRGLSPPLARMLPYARAAGGPGSVLSGRVSPFGASAAAALAVAASVALLGWDGAIAAGAAAAVAIVGGVCFRLWIGGVTGDTLGAATQLGEIAVLVTVLGLR
jgi:adenosylcobinamide-GDP ribazoletransferase